MNIRNEDAGKVSEILWEDYGIATRAGAHCAPLMHELLEQLNREWFGFSFSSFNTYGRNQDSDRSNSGAGSRVKRTLFKNTLEYVWKPVPAIFMAAKEPYIKKRQNDDKKFQKGTK